MRFGDAASRDSRTARASSTRILYLPVGSSPCGSDRRPRLAPADAVGKGCCSRTGLAWHDLDQSGQPARRTRLNRPRADSAATRPAMDHTVTSVHAPGRRWLVPFRTVRLSADAVATWADLCRAHFPWLVLLSQPSSPWTAHRAVDTVASFDSRGHLLLSTMLSDNTELTLSIPPADWSRDAD